MQVDSISQLNQLLQLQNMLNASGSASASDSTSQFSVLLDSMLNNTSTNNSTNTEKGNATNSDKSSSVTGLDNISLTPQNMARMIQMDMYSNTIGSISDSSSDETSNDYGIGSVTSGDNYMSQFLQLMIQNQINSGSSNSQDTSSSNQTNTNNIKNSAI